MEGISDPKSVANNLIEALGSLPEVLATKDTRLSQLTGDDRVAAAISSFNDAMYYCLRLELEARPILPNTTALNDYLRVVMAGLTSETVRILYLTGQNALIMDEVIGLGSLDQVSVQPREIVHRALDLSAANIIIVHNHPSGDPHPSRSDIRWTKRLNHVASGLNICVLDHVVIGRGMNTSMRQLGHL